MTENLSFDLNQAYQELKEMAEAQGITSQEAYDDLCENFITDKVDVGELDKDEDTEAMIEDLKANWPEYEKNLSIH